MRRISYLQTHLAVPIQTVCFFFCEFYSVNPGRNAGKTKGGDTTLLYYCTISGRRDWSDILARSLFTIVNLGLCPCKSRNKTGKMLFMQQNCVTTMLYMCFCSLPDFFFLTSAVPQNNHIVMFVCALQQETPLPLPCRPPLSGSQTTTTSSPSSPCARPTSPMMTCATSRPAGRKPSRSASSTWRRRPSLSSTDGRWVAVPFCCSSSFL